MISFERRKVLALSCLDAASSAALSFSAADFHKARARFASATCSLACASAAAAVSLSTSVDGFAVSTVFEGEAVDGTGVCDGCHNAQALANSPSAAIDTPPRNILSDVVNECDGETFADFSIDIWWLTDR